VRPRNINAHKIGAAFGTGDTGKAGINIRIRREEIHHLLSVNVGAIQ
jgi:hypothetical protein